MGKIIILIFTFLYSSILLAENLPSVNTESENFNFYKKKFRRKVFSSNAFYFEAAGLATKWSINYDRVLSSTDNTLLTARLGYGMFKDEKGISISKIPITLNALFGKKHYLEIGGGGVYSTTKQNKFVPAADFGYRYQNPKGSIVVRVVVTITYESTFSEVSGRELYRSIVPFGGISLGYNF